MITAILDLVESKNCPVMAFPAPICFNRLPVVGESFLFGNAPNGQLSGHTSEVKKISFKDGAYILKTRNSVYRLEP